MTARPGRPVPEVYPREIAIRILGKVLGENETLDSALASVSGEIRPEAAGWLQEVCSGTLRWKGRLDAAIDAVALKKKPTGWLRRALLTGAYQLIGQERTSPAAAVSETVSVVKKKEGEAPAKFANALLRKIADHAGAWRAQPFPVSAGAIEQAAWASLPEWFWKKLVSDHGSEWARDFALASLDRPKVWLRARRADWGPDWVKAGPVPGSFEVTEGGAITAKPGFREGEFLVQDISSQLLVFEISSVVLGESRESKGAAPAALDLCAAPGGKSVGLAWSGFQVSAADRDETRYRLLRQTTERLAEAIRVIPRGEVASLPEQDLVWVDAPCTGSGIVRRHPDVRWLRKEQELSGLLKVQRELVAEAWTRVRAGGFLAYSVCSVLRDEGPGTIESAQEGGLLPSSVKVREWALQPQTAPFGDGFWAVLLRKDVHS